jgi:GNAT superfamily N-acetyltransferase
MTINSAEIIGIGQLQAGLAVEVTSRTVPQRDFLFLFSRLFRDKAINNQFERYYVPVLERARARPGVRQHHYVLYSNNEPVSCASMYWRKEIACLYNVGTHAAQQNTGYGALFSRYALADVAKLGCKTIFLQCECDTHIERLYKAIGFAPTFTPYSVVLLNG